MMMIMIMMMMMMRRRQVMVVWLVGGNVEANWQMSGSRWRGWLCLAHSSPAPTSHMSTNLSFPVSIVTINNFISSLTSSWLWLWKQERIELINKLIKVSKLCRMFHHRSQVLITLLSVIVTAEDLHDFLGLNVPFFNRDSGKAVYLVVVIYEILWVQFQYNSHNSL